MATTNTHLLHLIAWAQIGVVLRVYLGLLFGGACHEYGWAPCVTSPGTRAGGALFIDLPANIAGSFLMGLFVSSDVLSSSLKHTLTVEAPLAVVSVRSPLQAHLPLHVGLRTGLCGSLTTFASWNLQMVVMFVGGRPVETAYGAQWVDALVGLVIGTFCAMAALVVGQHTALMIYHKLNPGAFIPYSAPVQEQAAKIISQADTYVGKPTVQPADEELIIEEQDFAAGPIRRLSSRSYQLAGERKPLEVELQTQPQQPPAENRITATAALQPAAAAGQPQSMASKADAVSAGADGLTAADPQGVVFPAAVSGVRLPSGVAGGQAAVNVQHPAVGRAASQSQAGRSFTHRSAHISIDSGALTRLSSSAEHATNTVTIAPNASMDMVSISEAADIEAYTQPRLAPVVAADAYAGAVTVLLTGISLWRIIHGSLRSDLVDMHDGFAQQYIWWAIILGPVGCFIRYYLARYNGVLPGHWKWFPLGTFTANISACIIDYAVKAALARVVLDTVSTALLSGVVSGIGGCLSTVSTWVVEIQRLLLTFPNTHHGYNYIFISFVASFAFGFIIYGIPVWTMPV